MKKLLSIFATVGLISTSSLQLVSCNDNQKNKDSAENKENEQKGKDEDNNNNGNITDNTKPLTAQQIAEELKTKFEAKKTAFVEKLNQSIPNTVADFYNTVENEFKADEKKPAKIVVEIKNKRKDETLVKTSIDKIFKDSYSISITITVTENVNNISNAVEKNVSFDCVLKANDIILTNENEWKWTHKISNISVANNSTTNKKEEEITFFDNWEEYKINPKIPGGFYSSVTIDYELELKGHITTETPIKKMKPKIFLIMKNLTIL